MPTTIQKYNVPVLKSDRPDDTDKFLPTPNPTGPYPYHLALQEVQQIVSQRKMVFHMMGDTGSIRSINFLKKVTGQLFRQFEHQESEEDQPRFLYHLGDVVYNHGEAREYQKQFFEPFQNYPAPIFAIAGNHDSDINLENPIAYQSLDAFKAVFCDTVPQTIAFSGNALRKSMVQPHVFWTLETPLAVIIGLHSNVPKYGVITPEQRNWLVEELVLANQCRPDKAVILCMHHSPYSADTNHGSSIPMIQFLEDVFKESETRPDIVFSGHVHNYQRFSKTYKDGRSVPYIVAGAGGYDELHPLAFTNNRNYSPGGPWFEGVTMQSHCDDHHGFLKITLEKSARGLILTGAYYTIHPDPRDAAGEKIISILTDQFVVEI